MSAKPPALICRSCYEDIFGENNPTMICPKCGMVNRPVRQERGARASLSDAAEGTNRKRLLLVIMCLFAAIAIFSLLR
jgi:predicted RNA-binding Zn-ribbon protein involved in translation (DUF1610 family)